MAKNYAEKVVMRSGQITKAEINRLLEEHAVQVQALKKKQAAEKKRLKALLEKDSPSVAPNSLPLPDNESGSEEEVCIL